MSEGLYNKKCKICQLTDQIYVNIVTILTKFTFFAFASKLRIYYQPQNLWKQWLPTLLLTNGCYTPHISLCLKNTIPYF